MTFIVNKSFRMNGHRTHIMVYVDNREFKLVTIKNVTIVTEELNK